MARIDVHTVLAHSIGDFINDGVSRWEDNVSVDSLSGKLIVSYLAASIPKTSLISIILFDFVCVPTIPSVLMQSFSP